MTFKSSSSSDQHLAPLGDRGIDPGEESLGHAEALERAPVAEPAEPAAKVAPYETRASVPPFPETADIPEVERIADLAHLQHIADMYRQMTLNMSESRDELKHENRKLKEQLDQHAADLATLRSERDEASSLRAENHVLRARVDTLELDVAAWKNGCEKAELRANSNNKRAEAAEADLATLRAQLTKYGQHLKNCECVPSRQFGGVTLGEGGRCTCGLRAALTPSSETESPA